jgi:hypothetical protein
MWHSRVQQTSVTQGRASALALEANAACAGLALACTYSSSDEFEAEIIRNRRAAGAYGVSYQRELAMIAAAIAICALLYLAH